MSSSARFGATVAMLFGLLGCAASASKAVSGGSDGTAGSVGAAGGTAVQDAASPFGNATAGSDAGPMPKLIDDGGIALLPDGAMIYVKFSSRPCPPGSTLTYANFGAAFFQNYCLRCHSVTKQGADRNDAPMGLNFDELTTVQMLAPTIWGQAGDSNTTMPAGAPKPTAAERAQLGEWLACGAPASGSLTH